MGLLYLAFLSLQPRWRGEKCVHYIYSAWTDDGMGLKCGVLGDYVVDVYKN